MKLLKCFLLTAVLALSTTSAPAINAAVNDTDTYVTIFGDANTDGEVNGNDVISMMKYFLLRTSEKKTVEISLTNIDLDRNDKIELTDFATLKQYTVGDNVSMSGRSFNPKSEKSDDNMLLKYNDRWVAYTENVSETSLYCATSYNDACAYLEKIHLENNVCFLDTVNIPGSPAYNGSRSYDIVFIFLLPDTSLGLAFAPPVNMTHEDRLKLYITNGELWATPDGFDIRDMTNASNDSLVMFSVNLQTLYAAGNKFGLDVNSNINGIPYKRNGKT